MEDIFHDPEFTRFGDGVKELDEDIGRLVYTLFKTKLLETKWSCSGHIGTYLLDVGRSSRPETHHIYATGLLFFNVPNNDKSKSFFDITKSLVAQTPFASYKEPHGEYGNHHHIYLEMADLSDNQPKEEFRKKWGFNYRPEREVPIALAVARYEQFKKFWSDLDNLAKRF